MSGAEHFKVVGDLIGPLMPEPKAETNALLGKKRFAVAKNAFSTGAMVMQFLSL